MLFGCDDCCSDDSTSVEYGFIDFWCRLQALVAMSLYYISGPSLVLAAPQGGLAVTKRHPRRVPPCCVAAPVRDGTSTLCISCGVV